eukprot:CAMPEP_0179163462 /NCGR_PEP_ID=MMETSP0796-20121207/80150_1 /TAXON_ID=73915 /ORGANISM="Pyrodinium bahamense, Strain pbaha01" /LENGTH=111 /DNA_ID=CAMNT_0020865789 /DNA_START=378 /DNA_END=715 /DNA_ORIENTATION=+
MADAALATKSRRNGTAASPGGGGAAELSELAPACCWRPALAALLRAYPPDPLGAVGADGGGSAGIGAPRAAGPSSEYPLVACGSSNLCAVAAVVAAGSAAPTGEAATGTAA